MSAAGVSGDEAKGLLSVDDLYKMPVMVEQMQDGVKQVEEYGHKLEQKYKKLRLKKFVVVSLWL